MAYNFGAGTLVLQTNNLFTGGGVSTGTAGTGLQVSSGLLMIDGVTSVVSGQSSTITIAGSTGTGHLLYAYSVLTDTTTATLGILLAGSPIITSIGIPTAICPLATFSFGTGASVVSTIVVWSGGSATKSMAKVQNFKMDLSIEQAQMRGGGDVYPVDTQFFDGKLEGSFENADETATQLLLFGGIYASGGAASGTWSLSGTSKPEPVCLSFSTVTNGVTATYDIRRCYLSQKSMSFSRSDYEIPSYTFVAQANNKNNVLSVTQ